MLVLDAQLDGLDRELRGLVNRVADFERPARWFGGYLVRQWTKSFQRAPGHEPAPAGEPPGVQSHELANSLAFDVRQHGDVLEAGTNLIYGLKVHEGGTIWPSAAEALAVPVADKSYGKRPRDFGDLTYIPVDGGPSGQCVAVLVETLADGEINPLFALMEWVELEEHPWLEVHSGDWDMLRDYLWRYLGLGLGG